MHLTILKPRTPSPLWATAGVYRRFLWYLKAWFACGGGGFSGFALHKVIGVESEEWVVPGVAFPNSSMTSFLFNSGVKRFSLAAIVS